MTRHGQRALRLVDQGLSSLSNFLLGVGLARSLGVSDFGYVSLVVLSSVAVALLTRAVVGEVLLLRSVEGAPATCGAPTRAGLTSALAVGMVASLLSLALVAFSPATLRSVILMVCLALPILAVQDALRYVLLSHSEAGRACVIDAIWVAMVTVGVVAGPSAQTVTALWLGGAAASLAVGLALSRQHLNGGAAIRDWLAYAGRPRVLGLLADNALTLLTSVLFSAATLIVLDLTSLGILREALVPLAPIAVLNTSLAVLLLPEARLRSANRGRLLALGAGSLVLAPLWAGLLWVTGQHVGPLLVGDNWAQVRGYVVILSIYLGLQAMVFVAIVGLKHSVHPYRASRVRLGALAAQTVLVLVGAAVWGLDGAVFGLVAAWALMVPVAWTAWSRDLSGSRAAPTHLLQG